MIENTRSFDDNIVNVMSWNESKIYIGWGGGYFFPAFFLILQEKPQIWRLSGHFYSLETLYFYLEHQQTLFLGLFRPKINIDEISIFELNPWINQLFWKNHKYGDSGKTTIRKNLDQKETLFLVFSRCIFTKNQER